MRVEFQNLSKQYESGRNILKPMDFADDVHTLAVIGPSGGGKSTLLRIIGGLIAPTTGKLWVNSEEIEQNESSLQQYRKKIGFVFQQGGLFRHMNAHDNIAIPLEQVHGFSRTEASSRAMELLERFGLKDDWKKKPAALSGGQQQRVAIARAVASSPKLLLLDEPLSNLDAKLRIDMRAELQRLHKELGTTIIYVTHDQVEALTMSTKIALFKAGELNQVATPMELYNNPIDLEAADFIGNPRINFISGTAEMKGTDLVVKSELGNHTFPAVQLTKEQRPSSGEFECVLAVRPEQIIISREPVEGALPVTVYASQPAGSETIVTLKAGEEEFLSKEIGQAHYDIDQQVWAIIDQDKINVYNKETTRLIKRSV